MLRLIIPVAAIFMLQSGCDSAPPRSDIEQQQKQETLRQEANAQVGMPGITNFTEMKLMRQLYELRDKEIATYSYTPDMNGKLWHICDSIGYGLPYGTQFSNPEKIVPYGQNTYVPNTSHVIPQSEPNGLFMPPTAEGTWIICGTAKDLKPVYVEPKVIVAPFKLRSDGEYFIKE
jgi:hypothetical protein